MLSEDNILTIGDSDFGHHWTMTLDLNVIAKDCGVLKKETWKDPETGVWYKESHILLTMNQARKIINMILEYATVCEVDKIDEIFRKNRRLYKIWREKREKRCL